MYYLGSAFCSSLPCRIRKSVVNCFLCSDASKVWYISNGSKRKRYDQFVTSRFLDKEFLDDDMGGVRQIIDIKNTLFNPRIMLKAHLDINVTKLAQMELKFVSFGPGANNGRLKTGYNLVTDKHFADFLSAKIGRTVVKNKKMERPPGQNICGKDLMKGSKRVNNFFLIKRCERVKHSMRYTKCVL